MPKELFFIDSVVVRNYDPVVGAIDSNYFYHSYNFWYPLKYPLQNVSKITLKTVELPIGSSTPNNVRLNNDTNLLSFSYNIATTIGAGKSLTIPLGNYSTIASLITAINTAITGTTLLGSPTITFGTTTSTTTGQTHCTITHNCSSFTLFSGNLSQTLLGLGSADITSATTITGKFPINIFTDPVYYMKITNLPMMNNNMFPYTFKIPLNNIVNNTVYYNDTKDSQTINFNTSTFILDKLNIILVDSRNTSLTGYFNWTMSFEIEYDNNKDNQFLDFNN